MISINSSSVVKPTDHSAVSPCVLGTSNQGTGLSGVHAVRPASPVAPVCLAPSERDERPRRALEAVEAQAVAKAYACAAAGSGFWKQMTQHHPLAFRGPDPWSDPA